MRIWNKFSFAVTFNKILSTLFQGRPSFLFWERKMGFKALAAVLLC